MSVGWSAGGEGAAARRRPLPPSLLRVAELLRKELRQIFRDPQLYRILFVAPIVQLIVFGYAVSTDVRHTATFLVDHDRTPQSRRLADALTAGGFSDADVNDIMGENWRWFFAANLA